MTEFDNDSYSFKLTAAKNIIGIALALTAEHDINRLLERILDEALRISTADAGTLYIVTEVTGENETRKQLDFAFVRNKSQGIRILAGSGTGTNKFPPVPLQKEDGSDNLSYASSYAALAKETLNIKDIYDSTEFNFEGARAYDEKTGYRSRSMLVIPMIDHENNVIGVLQLLNATNYDTEEVIPFDKEQTNVVSALASLAATALSNRQLIANLKHLFDSFIKSIAAAVDEKSPYTGGHINRVVELVQLIAEGINAETTGPLADAQFSEDELEELKIAAWMHDVGKITTPEYVVNKSTKLETIRDGIHVVHLRFQLMVKELETFALKKIIAGDGKGNPLSPSEVQSVKETFQREKEQLESDLDFICKCNESKFFMKDDHVQRLEEIAGRQMFPGHDPLLTSEELENLSIRKGNLTTAERKVIENHVVATQKILCELPFPQHLKKVPQIASAHHEKLDGSGYPYGKGAKDLDIPTRIMAIADIFEALTAPDRPYKQPMSLSMALDILGFMEKDGHIDKEIVRLFREKQLFGPYARQYLKPEQVDV